MKKVYLALFIILITMGCEDEFCLDDTTPSLIIRFRDIDTNQLKPIRLTAGGVGLDAFIENTTLDSLAIPINTQSNTVTYLLSEILDDDTESTESLTLTYDIEDEFVSKACGFRSVFKNIQISTTNNDWLLDFEVLTEDITNENRAHVEILH